MRCSELAEDTRRPPDKAPRLQLDSPWLLSGELSLSLSPFSFSDCVCVCRLGSLPECSIPQNTEVMKQYKLDVSIATTASTFSVCVYVCVCVCVCVVQVGKLVMELDTLYMASENQSTAGSGEGHTASEAPAELIRTAKTLPELRVSL